MDIQNYPLSINEYISLMGIIPCPLVSERVKAVERSTISKIFPFLVGAIRFLAPTSSVLRSSLPSVYKTDATGHDITAVKQGRQGEKLDNEAQTPENSCLIKI